MVLEACPDIVDYAKGGISNWRDFLGVAAVVRSMLGISPSAWEAAQSVMGELPAAIVVAAILQRGAAISQRRRLSQGTDAKGRGRRIQPGADADGAYRRAKPRKEEGVAGWRARSAQKPFLLSRATGVEAVSAEMRRCHRAMDRRQRLHSAANPSCYEKPNRGPPRSPLPQAGYR